MEHFPQKLDEVLGVFLSASDRQCWDRYDFDWLTVAATRPHPLTQHQIQAVKTALLVEDHIPGYSDEYRRLFPIDDSLSQQQLQYHRAMRHFIFRWDSEEDRHAHVLELYLRETKAVDGDALTKEMLSEVVKPYRAPHDDYSRLFIYTSLQEKATQLFYQCLCDSVDEPVLKSILTKIAGEEARHCTFFGEMVKLYLGIRGEAFLKDVRDVLDQFKMPLSDLIEDYKRQAANMVRQAKGYNEKYQDAFRTIAKLIRRHADAPLHSHSHELRDFLTQVIDLGPKVALAR